jgi:MoaA/NifB/PqqE/SkfB family radical SAM enzyme
MKKTFARLFNRLEKLSPDYDLPNFCCFGITDECILKCKMCRKWENDISVKTHDSLPSVSDWQGAIDSLQKITKKGFLINFGGGEPFLFDGLLDVVRFATDRGFKTNIATNAYLIDEDMAKRIFDSGLTTLNISLDSSRESTHDYMRGITGVYKNAVNAIGYLHKYCPSLKKGICCGIYDYNIDEIVELAEFVQKDKRLEWLYFMAAMQPNNSHRNEKWYKTEEFGGLWPKDKLKVNSTIAELLRLKEKGYKIVNSHEQLNAFRSYFEDPGCFVRILECNLSRAVHVSSLGDVFICFEWDRLGNIKSDRLEDLWYSQKAQQIRKDISQCRRNCHFLLNCFFEGDFPFSF